MNLLVLIPLRVLEKLKKKMSDEGGGAAATRTRSKARVMQEMDANATTGGPKLPPSSAQTMSKIQSRCVRLVVDSRRIKKHRFRITRR